MLSMAHDLLPPGLAQVCSALHDGGAQAPATTPARGLLHRGPMRALAPIAVLAAASACTDHYTSMGNENNGDRANLTFAATRNPVPAAGATWAATISRGAVGPFSCMGPHYCLTQGCSDTCVFEGTV